MKGEGEAALRVAAEEGNWIENIRGERNAVSDVSSGDETGSYTLSNREEVVRKRRRSPPDGTTDRSSANTPTDPVGLKFRLHFEAQLLEIPKKRN